MQCIIDDEDLEWFIIRLCQDEIKTTTINKMDLTLHTHTHTIN